MALRSNESPGVTIKEIDLSGTVPAVGSTTGAFIGDFAWGPVGKPVFVANESELVSTFGSPKDGGSSADFLAVSQFLKYSGSAFVTRASAGTTAKAPSQDLLTANQAVVDAQAALDAEQAKTEPDDDTVDTLTTALNEALALQLEKDGEVEPVMAKHPGSLGDNLKVVVTAVSESVLGVDGTSTSVSTKTVDVEYDGEVVESYANLTETVGDERYILEYVNRRSNWIELSQSPQAGTFDLDGGTDAPSVTLQQDYVEAYGDVDQIQIDFMVAHNSGLEVSALAGIAQNLRKDCIVVASPPSAPASLGDVVDSWADNLPSTSYLVLDGNWVQVYNKYLDQYEFIPACSSTAGIMASTDISSAPWFSPAGTRRGQYFGVSALAFNPTKGERDQMYAARVNPIVSMPGQGTVLFGDKTALARPSAFDRINVRRLFLVIERAIGEAAKNVMFELNDDFTRAEFTNIVEPFLREVQGRRGITDFRVVCDETNNTSEVVDRNEFIASCFIKPARSINYVTLNFVAVRTGVEFEEVVGTV